MAICSRLTQTSDCRKVSLQRAIRAIDTSRLGYAATKGNNGVGFKSFKPFKSFKALKNPAFVLNILNALNF